MGEMQPIWIAAGVGVFLVGALFGAFLTGVLIGRLFDFLIDGLSLNLMDDIERRFKVELLNREYEVEPQGYSVTDIPASVTPPLGNAATVTGV